MEGWIKIMEMEVNLNEIKDYVTNDELTEEDE